ncbi:MAG: protein kinase [candidate division Zixibacteria bacterium]|nr:protein kinase [candidate division Zixibacteria bacterium]
MIGQTISHYEVIEKLGEGGMGIVYKALDLKLDRPVAIKFLPPDLNASRENKERFIREAKIVAGLNHPNILHIYDIDEQDGRLFFVMEFITGETLKSHIGKLKSGENISLQQAINWTIQIGQGLRAAHEKDIVHRDIKPENIMMTRNGLLKIMDFGIARLKSDTDSSDTDTLSGTLAYMSPEQAQGIIEDHRTDIWSLGVMFYEMLTGDLPFRAEHEAAWIYLIVNEDPLNPSSHDRRISPAIDSCVMKMLEKDREQRFRSADELLTTLRQVQIDVEQATQSVKTKAIALLPFQNISPDKESDYFSDGLTEELILNLSRLENMRVVSRTSIMQYKGTNKDIKTIGKELGVRYILEGSVRKLQDDLRITAQLVDVETDAQLWAGKFRGKLSDVFDIQEKVSEQIIDALLVRLSPTEKGVLCKRCPQNAEAFDYYLRARDALYRWTKNDIKSAIELFQRAIELDSRYAVAYAGLGEAYATLYQNFERKESYIDRSMEASLKALAYDATLSEAYAALGLAYFEKKMLDEALSAVQKAIELDPNSFVGYWILGRIYHTTDRDREAIELYKKVVALNPDFYTVRMDLRTVYERLGDKENYEDAVRNELEVYPRYIARYPKDPRAHIFYAVALARAGRIEEGKREAAKAIELNPSDPLMLYNTACFYAKIKEKRLALDSLKNSILAGFENYEWIRRDPDLDSIRNEPEYIALIEKKDQSSK